VRVALASIVMAGAFVGAFFGGRASVDSNGSAARAYLAGREDAFSGFDGGWSYGRPYIVTLRRGGPGITYRFARRWPMLPGLEYRACRRIVCSRSAR
jgi:hypothetical protein